MKIITVCMLFLFVLANAQAALKVEITEGTERSVPVAILPFTINVPKEAAPTLLIEDVVSADLLSSGRFAPVDSAKLPTTSLDIASVDYSTWQAANVNYIVAGALEANDQGYELTFRLLDVYSKQQLLGYRFQVKPASLRQQAHQVSNLIYEELTGKRGYFLSRIAYVNRQKTEKGLQYRLLIADMDGFNEQSILTASQPIVSPTWSPDGRKLAYASFEKGSPEIIIQDIFSGEATRLPAFKGLNSAPAWSHKGDKLAVTLSKNGNPDIYIYDLASKDFAPLTKHWAIDTEPAWSSDDQFIVFTSSRSGGAQLYKIPVNRGLARAKRLTFEGRYNANADISDDGQYVAFVQGVGNQFFIALLDLETGLVQRLSNGSLDESPSFAPNGTMILYAKQGKLTGELATVSLDGRFKQRIILQDGDVKEPAWSPFLN